MSLSFILLLYLLLWNLLVFITYGADKLKAKRGVWRISEKLLLIESYVLGGLGAYLAGLVFHHKTRKWYFRLAWYLGLLGDVIVIYLVWRI
ncbi:DUF1294 domain-containing protein [Streptococcus saliviloxodontae]|uniref:Uncharacterized membrane protein YsdA (DUF1294 family) n=1 Tax=Streptococcus saliviloxodontae TaxID=1349416 RepID=A0ABS2PLU6_9STRE|nr:DUF1294 domain-containing protein [Streptococcus saliviloxodontae]MBM7636412.1 uncharacterized membrane protein YsdA (DUF1294 family) [Streptococcus saliviloxodontae]